MTATANRARIGVITNPGSQRNKAGLDAMRHLLDGQPNVDHAVLDRITDIPAILARFAAAEIDVLAVAGGDGTVQAVLTELLGKRPFREVPSLAIVPRGMTNMIAADVGLARRGARDTLGALARLVAASPAALAAGVERRHILRAENILDRAPQYGMFFGGAGIPRAIDACRAKVHPLKIKSDSAAAVTLAGLLGSWLLGRGKDGERRDGIFYGDPITVTLDDGPPETLEALVILATTLDRLILRSRPFWGGDGAPLRFTTIAYPPRGLLRHAWRILYGGEPRRLPPGYRSRASHRVALTMDCPFTLDGEMFRPEPGRALILTAADEARFVRL
ncbi:MAG: diacylglycerol kinase family protein [Bacteroidota bacterium]|nr:diacylglycerol kinase family protein [Kiloniellaceae bacterium]